MKLYHVTAIFKKTLRDMIRNKRQLLFFLMFPAMTYLFYATMKDGREMFPIVFLPINVLFCSMNIMASIIAEEKEKGTLKSLIFANIKPLEYFIGNGLFVLLASLISCSLFIPLINISGINYLYFYVSIILSSLCSMVLGAAIGISAKNQMAANGMCAPITIVLGMLPTFGALNESMQNITKLLYSTRFADTIAEIINQTAVTIDYKIILTYIINFIICITVFSIVYRKKKLDD